MYITKANARNIIKKINIQEGCNITGELYKKPIYFLSSFEVKELLLIQALFKNPCELLNSCYTPINKKDTYTLVFEESHKPAYHQNKDCPRLTSKFKNFKIPFEIKTRVRTKLEKEGRMEEEIILGEKNQVEQFRCWFKDNYDCYENDIELFLRKLDVRWNIKRQVAEVEYNNSGAEVIHNYDLKELECRIDAVISDAGKFYVSNKEKQPVIRKFQKLTFLAYIQGPIAINDTVLSDVELKEFLHDYNLRFKNPIKHLLIEFYRIKFNPDLSFDGYLLEQLNFKPCTECVK